MSVPSSQPGLLVVSLETPGTPAGAVLLVVQGEGIGAPSAIDPSRQLFVRALDQEGAYRVAVVGDRVSGALFTLHVPDINQPQRYALTLLEVADDANGLRADVTGYRLSFAGNTSEATGVTIY